VRLFRVGNKVISLSKITDEVTAILEDRERGATQEEASRAHGVQRSFVSLIESLGEIRRGGRIALVGFPISNTAAVRQVAERHALDFVLVFSQGERESIENGPAADIFNQLLETIAVLKDYDVLVLLASDWRIKTIERILGREVVGIPLGHSPIRQDVEVDVDELEAVLGAVESARKVRGRRRARVGAAIREAADLAARWKPSGEMTGRRKSSRKS
jgi:hypothetical protein